MSYLPLIARVESLPPLPESVLKIEKLFLEEDPDIDKLVKIIELDPSLTADILSKVNAPLYGFSRTIVSVLQAVTLFGSPQIRSIVLASTIQRSFDVDVSPYNITTADFSKICVMQGELIFQWYMGINIDIARTLTPIAFLMDTGKILIAKDVIENDKKDEFLADLSTCEGLNCVETKHVMMTSAQIDALIFQHLNLNQNFYECMKYVDNEHEIPENMKEMVQALQIVRTAINVKEQLTENSINEAIKLLEKASLDVTAFQRVVKRIKIKYNID